MDAEEASSKKILAPPAFLRAGVGVAGRVSAEESSTEVEADDEQQTGVIPFDVVRLQKTEHRDNQFTPPQDLVFLSPNEEKRRFPLFTTAQKTLIGIGAGLLIMMLVIAYLLWRQQRRDQVNNAGAVTNTAPAAPAPVPSLPPSPTPLLLAAVDDAAVTEAVKTALMAYSPLGFSRYKFEVKEGVVTVNGEAEHQPEKDGVENVVRLIAGVKSVVNNLKLKPESSLPWQLPNQPPVKVNTAEAKILEDAMRRQVQLAEQATSREPVVPREVREQALAKQREEDAASRKAAEEQVRRETEEAERRQEEARRAEAARRARAEQARVEPGALRNGTVAWSGLVDGVEEIVIGGSSASVRHVSGPPARDVKTSFSAPVPRSPVAVKLISSNGRTPVTIIQEPSAANGYTTIVRIDDSAKGGEKLYQFTLRWSAQ
ncbi:MAG: BON domain-containing protein [Blastocatellia bacterium]